MFIGFNLLCVPGGARMTSAPARLQAMAHK
jgi:hypothetical protein